MSDELLRVLKAMLVSVDTSRGDIRTVIETGISEASGEYYLVERWNPVGHAEWMGLHPHHSGHSPREFWTTDAQKAIHFVSTREAESHRRFFDAIVTGHMDCTGPRVEMKQEDVEHVDDAKNANKSEETIVLLDKINELKKRVADLEQEQVLPPTESILEVTLGEVRSWLAGQIRFRESRLTDQSLVALMGKQIEKIDAALNTKANKPSE